MPRSRTTPCLGALTALLLVSVAAPAQQRRDPRTEAIVRRVNPARMHATVAKLVSFGTRHTLSDATSPTRGIGAARRWLAAEFEALAKAPGSRLRPFEDRFTAPAGRRIPQPLEILNVGAVLPGTDLARAKEALVLTGHYDSRASDPLDAQSDAPGANDDGSGTSMALELARVMAEEKPAISLYFVAVAGEEQGLVGSDHLAQRLKDEGIQVLAMISVDIAGNSQGQDGVKDNSTGRIFSEGVPAAETEEQRKLREAVGGENDSPAREWARYLQRAAERYVDNLQLLVMLRRDRIAAGPTTCPSPAEVSPGYASRRRTSTTTGSTRTCAWRTAEPSATTWPTSTRVTRRSCARPRRRRWRLSRSPRQHLAT